MTYQRPDQPASIGKVLVDGFLLFRASLGSLYLPVFLLLIIAVVASPFPTPFGGTETAPDFGGVFWLRLGASLVVSTYLYAFIVAMVHYIASGAPQGVHSPLSIATRRFPVVLAVTILYGIAGGIGMTLLIVPGVFALVVLFASPILPITEGRGPIESMRSSYELVKGHWWRTFAIVMISTVAVTLMGLAVERVAASLGDWFDNGIAANTVVTLTYAALVAIIHPLCFCIIYGWYVDLRVRHENLTP